MIDHIPVYIAIIGILFSALSGFACAVWWVSSKNTKIEAHEQALSGCPVRHDRLMVEIKAAVCSGFKVALKEMSQEIDRKIGAHDKDIAVLAQRMQQAENHIDEIFGRLNRREQAIPVERDRRE